MTEEEIINGRMSVTGLSPLTEYSATIRIE